MPHRQPPRVPKRRRSARVYCPAAAAPCAQCSSALDLRERCSIVLGSWPPRCFLRITQASQRGLRLSNSDSVPGGGAAETGWEGGRGNKLTSGPEVLEVGAKTVACNQAPEVVVGALAEVPVSCGRTDG